MSFSFVMVAPLVCRAEVLRKSPLADEAAGMGRAGRLSCREVGDLASL